MFRLTYVKAVAAAKHRVRAAAEYFMVVKCDKFSEQQQNNEIHNNCFSFLFTFNFLFLRRRRRRRATDAVRQVGRRAHHTVRPYGTVLFCMMLKWNNIDVDGNEDVEQKRYRYCTIKDDDGHEIPVMYPT